MFTNESNTTNIIPRAMNDGWFFWKYAGTNCDAKSSLVFELNTPLIFILIFSFNILDIFRFVDEIHFSTLLNNYYLTYYISFNKMWWYIIIFLFKNGVVCAQWKQVRSYCFSQSSSRGSLGVYKIWALFVVRRQNISYLQTNEASGSLLWMVCKICIDYNFFIAKRKHDV